MEKQVKIKTGRSLSQIIDSIVRESNSRAQMYQNAVDEKMRQSKMIDEEDDLFADDESSSDKKSSKTMDDEKEKLKKGNISTDDVVSKLNTIRGGKSFKDDLVANRLDEYFKSLSKAEKIALFAFLKGLAQIVTGEVPADDVIDPSNPPAEVEMEKTGNKKSVKAKTNVVKMPKKDEEDKKKPKSSKEDTSGPVPISPKK
jgi:hypothetical protein